METALPVRGNSWRHHHDAGAVRKTGPILALVSNSGLDLSPGQKEAASPGELTCPGAFHRRQLFFLSVRNVIADLVAVPIAKFERLNNCLNHLHAASSRAGVELAADAGYARGTIDLRPHRLVSVD